MSKYQNIVHLTQTSHLVATNPVDPKIAALFVTSLLWDSPMSQVVQLSTQNRRQEFFLIPTLATGHRSDQ